MSRPTLLNSSIGEYRLVDFLGAGGMGEVYRGVHSKLGRVVAIKVLLHTMSDPSFIERFLNEARIQASLQHPNVVTLYDFLEFNGQPCIIMEYIEGQTLTDRIRAYGALPLPEVIHIFQAILEALNYVHSMGIVHRDIKSNNVKISNNGQVKLLDFGIAKSGSSPALTATGGFIGTLQYLSPEQLKGGFADVRSDIWAMGVLLYEMVTGQLPFEATTLGDLYEKISKVAYTPPMVLSPSVPRELQAIISRCLKKNPSDRYQSARDLLQDINRLASTLSARRQEVHPIATAPQPVPQRITDKQATVPSVSATPSAKIKWPIIAAAAALFLVVAFGLYFFLSGDAPAKKAGGAQMKTFTLDTNIGQVDVYRNGQKVGVTPYQFEAAPGEEVDFILKRDGFADKVVELSISENKRVYTYSMQKK